MKMNETDAKVWFTHQVEDCMDSLYNFAFRLARNKADAEDLVAESVTKAWASIHTLDDRNKFRSWLFRIVHNNYVTDYRKKAVRPIEVPYLETSDSGDDGDFPTFLCEQSDEFLSWWGNPESAFANKVLERDILAAIEKLPDVFRSVVLLVTVEGLSYNEAANVLGVPPGTVHSRMKRGRTLLQRALWEHARAAGLIPEGTTKGSTR